ncbi:hypothetical protein [Pseudomonas aeruginosa]|uniref:hypothetical protein n=1 Tax=Pseudomonas aeruginosa TaxID=287 RepID=UPI000ABC6F06|nr:hypothetical protein [Pseudomonas aeruginosa]
MSSTQHQLIEQCATRLRGIVEALDNIHDTSPQRWSTDLDDVHSSAESLLAMIKDHAPPSEDQLIATGLSYPLAKEDAVKLWYSGFRSEVITVLEAWEAIGHDIGMNPSKGELLDSLRNMAAICNAHGNDMPAQSAIDQRQVIADAITGALAFGAQAIQPPAADHWLRPFYDIGRAEGQRTQDLAMLVRMLASSLKRHAPESNLVARATNYLAAKGLAGAALAQPSPAQAEAERPEVVGYRSKESGMVYEQDYGLKNPEALTTVAECERIVRALRAEIAEWQEAAGRSRSDVVAYIAERAKLLEERDAAQARVAGLEAELETERMRLAACGTAALGYFDGCADAYKSASLSDVLRLRADCDAALARVAELERQEPVGWEWIEVFVGGNFDGEEADNGFYRGTDKENILPSIEGTEVRQRPLYAAPVAQAQHSAPVPVVTPEMVMAAMAVFRLDVSPFKSMEAALTAALRKAAAPGKEGV